MDSPLSVIPKNQKVMKYIFGEFGDQLRQRYVHKSTPNSNINPLHSVNKCILEDKISMPCTCKYLFNVSYITFYCCVHFARLVKMPIVQWLRSAMHSEADFFSYLTIQSLLYLTFPGPFLSVYFFRYDLTN